MSYSDIKPAFIPDNFQDLMTHYITMQISKNQTEEMKDYALNNGCKDT